MHRERSFQSARENEDSIWVTVRVSCRKERLDSPLQAPRVPTLIHDVSKLEIPCVPRPLAYKNIWLPLASWITFSPEDNPPPPPSRVEPYLFVHCMCIVRGKSVFRMIKV